MNFADMMTCERKAITDEKIVRINKIHELLKPIDDNTADEVFCHIMVLMDLSAQLALVEKNLKALGGTVPVDDVYTGKEGCGA